MSLFVPLGNKSIRSKRKFSDFMRSTDTSFRPFLPRMISAIQNPIFRYRNFVIAIFGLLCIGLYINNQQSSHLPAIVNDQLPPSLSDQEFIGRNDHLSNRNQQNIHLRGAALGLPSAQHDDSFGIVLVADLDKKSKDNSSKKPRFISYLQHATLKIDRKHRSSSESVDSASYSIVWGEKQQFSTQMNEGGRGFELSELTWFNGNLLTFDDRTGIVFALKHFEGAMDIQAIPKHIIMEGDGVNGKGQKHEWATVKDGELYMGSIGKEFTDNDGNIVGHTNQWVAILDENGDVRHEDWTSVFAKIRTELGCSFPGYVIHEAIEWSAVHRQWFILPRRISTDPYNDEVDESRGSNRLVIASEDFSSIQVIHVGSIISPLRGFSSFKFLPRSQDSIVVAAKSVEVEKEGMQTSFLTVFDIKGTILLEETEVPGRHKFEGLAFTRDWTALDTHAQIL